MKKGFTLIELLGVIIIIALLTLLVLPKVVNSVKNTSDDTDELTKEIIYKASDLYISNHSNNFKKINGNKYIIDLKDLVDEKLLTSPIKLSESDRDITNSKCIQVTYNNGYEYELKDSGTCELKMEICKAVTNDTKTTGNVPQGNYLPGDEYICEVSSGMKYHFFILSVEGNNVNLIMDSNINKDGEAVKSNQITNKGFVSAITYQDYNSNLTFDPPNDKGPVTALNYLNIATSSWTNIPNIKLNYKDEGYEKIKGIGYKNITTKGIETTIAGNNGDKTGVYYNLKARMPMLKEVLNVGCKCSQDQFVNYGDGQTLNNKSGCPTWLESYRRQGTNTSKSCPKWLYNYLDKTGNSNPAGYYLLASDRKLTDFSYKHILDIYGDGNIGNNLYVNSNTNGIRPVITLQKTCLN